VIAPPIHGDPAGWGLVPRNLDDAPSVDPILLECPAQERAAVVIAQPAHEADAAAQPRQSDGDVGRAAPRKSATRSRQRDGIWPGQRLYLDDPIDGSLAEDEHLWFAARGGLIR
jgi:hypothetical protein